MTRPTPLQTPALDHLVVWANTLEEGAEWCAATLGVAPQAGGKHPLMGTHNRLLNVSGPGFEQAYLEIIAIDPDAVPQRAQGHLRWFDMDDPALRRTVASAGPMLVHWVARVTDMAAALQRLLQLGLDSRPALAASRATPQGELQWQIAIRPDGRRLLGGAIPTPIQWGDHHPTHQLPSSGVRLSGFWVQHPQPAQVQAALQAMGLGGVSVRTGEPATGAVLHTQKGLVTLQSRPLKPVA